MRRPVLLFALVWGAFLAIFPFAAAGDTSALHIGSHLVQIALLGPASALAWRGRSGASGRLRSVSSRVLSVTVPLALVCIVAELVTAVVRLGQDGWVNRDTADIWERGVHASIATLTVPAMLLSMLLTALLVVASSRRPTRTGG